MAARAIWKGVVRLGDVGVAVKLYSAAQERGIHFRLLHDEDQVPLVQRMVNPVTGKTVPKEDIRKGYEVDDGTWVILDEDDLRGADPDPSRDIHVLRFVEPARIGHQWYDRPYYLGPDGDEAGYAALADALARSNREGVVRWVMRRKEYAGALRSNGTHLLLITLRGAGEVIPASALPAPAGRDLDARELAMAEQLVGMLEDEFDPAAYRDEFRDRVMELIQARAEGVPLEPRKVERKPRREPLASALEKSLSAAREQKRRAA
jgi:DNA end-binding protein Ku